jgi:hypothetical protein
MGVDESREKERVSEHVVITRWRAIARANVPDDAVVAGDYPVCEWRCGDGNDPARMIADHLRII